jgi:DNA repair protein RadC
MNDTQEPRGSPLEQNTLPDALAEPEGLLLRAVFPGALFVPRLVRAPGGWRTLSKAELDALELTLEQQEAVLALQTLTHLSYPKLPRHAITDSAIVASVYGHRLGGLVHEVMIAIALDGRNHCLEEVEVAKGGMHSLSVQPRDVLRAVVRAGASSFLLLHNHPGGVPTPSPEDITMTRRMVVCANAVGVPLVDHVIVGGRGGGFASLLDLGLLEPG